MNTRPTPGPWHAITREGSHTVVDADGFPLAVMSESSQTAGANARIMALAPELLEALQSLAEFWKHGTPVMPDSLIVPEITALIQDAFPYPPADKRELLMTKLCDACFNAAIREDD